MKTIASRILMLVLLTGYLLYFVSPAGTEGEDPLTEPGPSLPDARAADAGFLPIFRFPVVPDVVISGYFDHNPYSRRVTHYNGNQNSGTEFGYYFSCSSPAMYDFVGCQYNVSGEAACPNSKEIWYDGHKGTDYEFTPNWHTGAVCNPNKEDFKNLTKPIYAAAAGRVQFAGYDSSRPGNGYHFLMKHDLNGNGNYNDDNMRSFYLHFTPYTLAVVTNQIVSEGQYLGLGGTSGYSSTPHLHFEVQRSSDNFTYTSWSVDPFGWRGAGSDPWPYANQVLWRYGFNQSLYLPAVKYMKYTDYPECPDCVELLRNSGFESGRVDWVEVGVDVITSTSNPRLPVTPYSGSWLSWLGGRNYAVDTLYQQFTVPQDFAGATLRYYLRKSTDENSSLSYDSMYIHLRSASGNFIQQLDFIDNTFTPNNQWVLREIPLPTLVNYKGEQLRISFEATTDSNLVTNFYLDEVKITTDIP
jgi:hypothetical protein